MSANAVMDTMGSRWGRLKRSWPEALKREIVAATLVPGSSVSIAARQYSANVKQGFSWRKRYSDGPRAPDSHAGDLFVFRGANSNLIKILWHGGIVTAHALAGSGTPSRVNTVGRSGSIARRRVVSSTDRISA